MLSGIKNLATGGERHPEQHNDQSLATVLPTHEARAALLLTIADSAKAMRQNMVDAFEVAEQDYSAMDTATNNTAEKEADKDKEAQDDDTKDAKEELEKQLSRQEIKDLQKAGLEHFDTWQNNVIQRISEALNQHTNDGKEQETPHSHSDTKETSDTKSESLKTLQKLYPPLDTSLRELPQAQRVLILHSLLLLLLSLETYHAESRVLMLRLCSTLALPPHILADDESVVAKGLLEAAKKHMNADQERDDRADKNSAARKWKVGLGAAAGAVLIGVTGGLAAPLLAAGVGSVMGGLGLGATATAGYLGALAGSAPLVGVLFGAYGGRMTGQMIDEYAKQVEDFAFLPIPTKGSDTRHLRVAVGISGWLTEDAEVVEPWKVFTPGSTEAFALRWELDALKKLGHALSTYVTSYAWSWAKKEIISRTIFAALSSALTLPYGLAKAARVVDNPFSVARSRSEKAGAVLADALINKVQGERPVTLIGYSLGSRVIYFCLKELARRQAFGLVESVCLIGAPVPSDALVWRQIRAVVPGRVVNVYSTKDYLLGFLYRTSSLQYGVAGLEPIRQVPGVENVDVSGQVDGHTQYRFLVGSLLQQIGLEGIDAAAVEKQMARFKEEKKKTEEAQKKSEAEGSFDEHKAEDLEKEVEKKNETAK